jgi:hypothetical protein
MDDWQYKDWGLPGVTERFTYVDPYRSRISPQTKAVRISREHADKGCAEGTSCSYEEMKLPQPEMGLQNVPARGYWDTVPLPIIRGNVCKQSAFTTGWA